ncbi:MAG: hypothetical protein GX685_03465 [Clostridiales bacterium]|nr:hypothetical protein [Clostridiales bacterium]
MKLVQKAKYLLIGIAAMMAAAVFTPGVKNVNAATQGIDVSQWQGTINWSAVKNSGISYAMVRAGNIAYGLDTMFAYNMTAANAAGVRTGVYCYSYALNAAQAAQEAQFVVAACQNFTVSFPIAIDIEDQSQKSLSPQQQAEIVNAFCAVIYNAGYTPMVYTSRSWFIDCLGPVTWDKWVAQYNSYCDYPGTYCMWQYTSSGSVSGIAGNVDMDYLYKDYFSIIKQTGFDVRGGYTYYYNNYKRVVGLQSISGSMYMFDTLGRMTTGWVGAGTQKYYFDPENSGAAALGWKTIAGIKYYFGTDFFASVGYKTIGTANYMFDANGAMVTGLYNNGVGIQYFDPATGAMAIGWTKIGDGSYYFDVNGYESVGLVSIGGFNYYFGADGKMLTGWQTVAGAMMYFGTDGKMATGFTVINGATYEFNSNGAMITGFISNADGTAYYFGADGKMLTGWPSIGGGWFYFGADGNLVRDTIFTDGSGIGVQVDANGLMIAPAGYVPNIGSM